jgi:hypothetical protein
MTSAIAFDSGETKYSRRSESKPDDDTHAAVPRFDSGNTIGHAEFSLPNHAETPGVY